MTTAILFGGLILLLALGVPVAFSIGAATMVAMLYQGLPPLSLAQKLFTGIDSFPLMAMPFFLLAAELMTGGALATVLLRFAAMFVGHKRGGLGYTNILTLTFFSGISGSAIADAAGPGAILIRMMRQSGYPAPYAAALTASTAVVGPIIPPSIIMIIYALQDESVSVLKLFVAGIIPGLMISGSLIGYNWWASRRRNFKGEGQRPPLDEMLRTTWRALPALFLPVLIVGGIHGGVFTPTEASVFAVFYALIVGMYVYGTLTWSMLPTILARSALLTASVLLIVGMSAAFAWVLTVMRVPQGMALWIGSLGLDPITFLLLVNVFLLLFGIFIEPLPGVMVLVPILAPMAAALGIDPLHFAIVVIVNLTIGMITPPVGGLLFVTAMVAKISLGELNKELWAMLGLQIVVLLLLTMFPIFSLWLPSVLSAR
ncbi:sialic acid TRAP transporter permease protein SiaT [Variibacter gotjawalensis]|uniref:TRAP transporter large permease protein n=1 Tax=Variibacter gotjawalensis TaxID=1333996 RepID=A0A0S3PVY0_9BRAD|nr:TRAP transporter large permease [Variibacter gotjawalensis]NIK45775.1 tripartite ATP-independent transporter DctM subunit [Variibacter gotjawalensis]RZS47699.1 tripartite ATP-independent transporter DctM subunit [Variibacter gotjawalensis]BAT59952.1 sialic acid TRAP transporter permease protein SiaT [Variibacter gotjawalensis]